MRIFNVEKLMQNVLLIIFVGLVTACSISKKMEHRYMGKTRDLLIKEFGEPNQILKLEDGNEQFVYVKETFIRETTISTGRATLDPRISPSFIKLEKYKYTINKTGVILFTAYEKSIK